MKIEDDVTINIYEVVALALLVINESLDLLQELDYLKVLPCTENQGCMIGCFQELLDVLGQGTSI
jgi:hypothetical protein